MLRVLTLLAMVSAVIHIRAEYLGPLYIIYIFKPLTMVLILSSAILAAKKRRGFYSGTIIAGLLFSMAGDVLLMLPPSFFIKGLVSFLIAHLFYIAAFSRGVRFWGAWSPAGILLVFGVLIYSLLAPYLGNMKIPVMAYIIVILAMGWRAWEKYTQTRKHSALYAFFGAVLFIVSDTILAWSRFREHFAAARMLNLSTYFTAQWLIAFSIWPEKKSNSFQKNT